MGSKKAKPDKARRPPLGSGRWHAAAGLVAAMGLGLWAYGPALSGPFVFDDIYLPFFSPHFAEMPLSDAVRGNRPFLLFTFWVNHHLGGNEPYLYHLINLLFHCANAVLVFLIARRLLAWSGTQGAAREWIAALCGGIFLLHPVQTEAVSYVASRSENLSVLFLLLAVTAFIYRKQEQAGWGLTALILGLYAAAASTKEHTVVLPLVLALIDYYWNPGFSLSGLRKNWRLYAGLAGAMVAGGLYVLGVLKASLSAGFGLKELPWHDYMYTQWRALWIYLRLFVLPFGQNVDYDHAVVRTPFDPVSLAGLGGLVLLLAAAIRFRRQYPLASFAVLCTLLLFAPTSSVVPIKDVVAERRLYMPMLGLVLLPAELWRQWKAPGRMKAVAGVAVIAVLGVLCHQRNQVWSSERLLWEDSVAKSPWNWRARMHLGVAYYREGRCEDAARQFETVVQSGRRDHRAYVNWALALDCMGRSEEALEKLRDSLSAEPTTEAWLQMTMILGKLGRRQEAEEAVAKALELNPHDDMAYVYRGNLRLMSGRREEAAEDYRRALAINPDNEQAQRALARLLARQGR